MPGTVHWLRTRTSEQQGGYPVGVEVLASPQQREGVLPP